MQLVTCPSTDDFVVFDGGVIAIRAAAFMGGARGTLAEITSADAVSGSYVEDTQAITWGGVSHTQEHYAAAADTLVIDPADLPLELPFDPFNGGIIYQAFLTIRIVGTANPGDGRWHETFWRYDPHAIGIAASETDFASIMGKARWYPRSTTHFHLVQIIGSPGRFVERTGLWKIRAYKRDPSAGDIALQIEQVILVPRWFGTPVGDMGSSWFVTSSTFGSKPTEAAVETSLESGIYTLDSAQPGGDDFNDIRDVQDNDGSDPEASSLQVTPPIVDLSAFLIGGGIVHAPDQEIDNDEFSRTETATWGDAPYGYHWRWWAYHETGLYSTPHFAVAVDGSQGTFGQLFTPGLYGADNYGSFSGQRGQILIIGSLNDAGVGNAPSLDCRDFRIRALVSWDVPPADVPAGIRFPDGLAEAGLLQVDIGQHNVANVPGISGWRGHVVARLNVLPDESVSLCFAQHYQTQAGTFAGANPPDIEYGGPESLGTVTAGTQVWVEYARQGYNLYAKAWVDGDTEPADYQIVERVQVPFVSAGTGQWDPYTYDTQGRENQSWADGSQAARATGGLPGIRGYAQTHFDSRITVACDQFRLWFHMDGAGDPTDVFLRVNEDGGAPLGGGTLNMGSKSQNWVLVGKRAWPDVDIYQWNDTGSLPLQWMITGLTYGRKYVAGGIIGLSTLRVAQRHGDRVTVRGG